MNSLFTKRICHIPRSFIREMLKVTTDPSVISFAGGLPHAGTFPVTEMADATRKTLEVNGRGALQYGTTAGYQPLRQLIAQDLQQRNGLTCDPDNVLIISGSQQGLDLIGKVFLEKADPLVIERPGYLGAIQALSIYEPNIIAVPVDQNGMDTAALKLILDHVQPRLLYMVPNFQNPSGITYSRQRRREIVDLVRTHDMMLIEDDPYGRLRFTGEALAPFKALLPEQTILLGSFSKTVAPGLRLGWICARHEIIERLIVAKQATDLHTSSFAQRILYQYLIDNDADAHIQDICIVYQRHRDIMIMAIERYFPKGIRFMKPEGGMFLWLTLPEGLSSLELFGLALKEKVAFVPGTPFYVDGGGHDCLRLNFSNADEDLIETGIQRLGLALERLMTDDGKQKTGDRMI